MGERLADASSVLAQYAYGMDLLKLWIKQERDKLMKTATEKAQ